MNCKSVGRNSNIEVLRLFSMFVIILHHSVLYGGAMTQPFSVNYVFSSLFFIGGKFGANCFMAISAFFLVGSNFKIQRLVDIWKTTYFYGVFFFTLNLIFHFRSIGLRDIFETAFPIFYKSYWYVTAYAAIIMLSPFFNYLVEKVTVRQYVFLLSVLTIMVVLPATFLPNSNPYHDESHVLLFSLIYFIVGFYKKGFLKNAKTYSLNAIIVGFAWMIIITPAIKYCHSRRLPIPASDRVTEWGD